MRRRREEGPGAQPGAARAGAAGAPAFPGLPVPGGRPGPRHTPPAPWGAFFPGGFRQGLDLARVQASSVFPWQIEPFWNFGPPFRARTPSKAFYLLQIETLNPRHVLILGIAGRRSQYLIFVLLRP